ncbi:hypothetical protein BGZ46_003369, partial [Entomortierella lignicola]
MKIPLSGHSMNQVPGTFQLLVAGGESNTNLTTSPILIYETSAGSTSSNWTSLTLSPAKTTTNTTTPTNTTTEGTFHRLYHASVTTGKNGVLLQGGYQTTVANGTVVSSLVTLKPKANSNTIEPLSTAPVSGALNAPALARHTMTLTSDGRAIILGGVNSQGVLSNLTYAYVMDTQANNAVWTMIPLQGKAPEPRVEFTSVMVNATTLLVYGGTSDYKSAFWVTFYLDLPSWTWSSPTAQGVVPRRWGHSATMVGDVMVVAFGLTSHQTPDKTNVVLLDTSTNTWIPNFSLKPSIGNNQSNPISGGDGKGRGGLSVGAVLGLAFVITALIVGGAFYLLVRRKKHKTRNTIAREKLGQNTSGPSSSNNSRGGRGVFSKLPIIFGLFSLKRNKSRSRPRSYDSKRYSDYSFKSQHQRQPSAVLEQMAQLGHPTPASLGYPDMVVFQGTGTTPISGYTYPNQACAHTEKSVLDGYETRVVFHDYTPGQKEAFKLAQEQQQLERQQLPQGQQLQQLQWQPPKSEM